MRTIKDFTRILLGAASIAVMATAVHAADAVIADIPEAPMLSGVDWSGFYAGAHAGYAWADRDWDGETLGFPIDNDLFDYDMDGALIGAQVGYNWQVNNFVFGIEADAAWSDASDQVFEPVFLFGSDVESEMDWLATIRGRAGYAFGRFLVYGTGGVAFAHVDTDLESSFLGVIPIATDSASATHTGWTAGIGVEAMVTEKISLKAEYLHADFGDEDFDYDFFGTGSNDTFGSADLELDTVRIGVNFHF